MRRNKNTQEKYLKNLISESVKRALKEAENGGWVVESNEVEKAMNMAIEYFGEEYVNEAIVRTLTTDQIAESLAYLFRMWDFEEWNNRKVSVD